MTEVLVVRLDRKDLSRLNSAARKRSVSRSAVVREALQQFLETEKPSKGVGWAEHFERLQKTGRKVDSKVVDEIIAQSRGREFP